MIKIAASQIINNPSMSWSLKRPKYPFCPFNPKIQPLLRTAKGNIKIFKILNDIVITWWFLFIYAVWTWFLWNVSNKLGQGQQQGEVGKCSKATCFEHSTGKQWGQTDIELEAGYLTFQSLFRTSVDWTVNTWFIKILYKATSSAGQTA